MGSSKQQVSDKKLRTVMELGVPVKIERSVPDSGIIPGIVVAFGSMWVIVEKLDDTLGLDGYVAIPRDDLVKAKRRRDREQFMLDTLAQNGTQHTAPPGIPTDDRWELFEWILESSDGLTTLRSERHDPPAMSCGEVTALGRKRITCHPLSATGTWLGPEDWPLKTITLVEFGGSHERTRLDRALDHLS